MKQVSSKPARVFIIDDHPLVRDGLAVLIATESDLEVCGSSGSMQEALQQIPKVQPDLLIVDLSLKDGLGLELIRTVKEQSPRMRMLVVSAFDEQLYAERALRCGALGYVNKQECETTLLQAIRTVLAGKRHVSEEILQRLLSRAIDGSDPAADDPVAQLTDRELEIYRLIGRGVKTGEIADQLFISPHTVDSHREKIRRKLGLKNGHELLQHAMRWIIAQDP